MLLTPKYRREKQQIFTVGPFPSCLLGLYPKQKDSWVQRERGRACRGLTLPLTLSLPLATPEKAGERNAGNFRCALNLAPTAKPKQKPSGHSPLFGSVGAFQDGPRLQPALAHPGRRKDLPRSACGEDPTFQNQLRAWIRWLPRPPHAPGSAAWRFPSLPEKPSPEGPPFVRGRARRRAAHSFPATKAPLRGRSPRPAPYRPGAPAATRSGAPIPNCPTQPARVLTSPQSLGFPRRLLHRPIAPQRLLRFQMDGQRLLQLHRWSPRAGRPASLYSIPAAGCREGGGSSQQRFKGPGARDAAPSLPPPEPGSADWYPGRVGRRGKDEGACAVEALAESLGAG